MRPLFNTAHHSSENNMDELTLLKEQVRILQARLDRLEKSDRYTFEKNLQLLDGRNIQLALSTGTKIGTAGTQKLAFYGSTPIIRPTGVAVSAGGIHAALVSLGLITS